MPKRVYTRFESDNSKPTKLQSKAIDIEVASAGPSIHGKKRKRDPIIVLSENTQVAHDISKRKNQDRRPATKTQANGGQDSATLAKSPNLEVKALRKQRLPREDQRPSSTLARSNGRHKTLNQRRGELLETRKRLPIWPHADKIRQGLSGERDVMLLVGETGSGKSTQVPQFIVDEPWCRKCIAITQPRRVAAVSLARRVAEEFGTPLGSSSPTSKVGYSVRFDTSVSPSTKIKFLTEGMLLQEMLRDPWLRQYSAVIVDEVHERSVNVDLILGFLRNLVSGDKKGRNGMPLKVVVMSATADVESLFHFFDTQKNSPVRHENDALVDKVDSEDSWLGICSEDDQPPNANAATLPDGSSHVTQAVQKPIMSSNLISVCHVEGRQYPVQVTYLSEPTQDFVEAALKAVFQIHIKEPLPGDILVFLTGQDTVEGLERLVNEYASTMDPKLPKVNY
jgi:ATP-dependent RNA helicase DHR2